MPAHPSTTVTRRPMRFLSSIHHMTFAWFTSSMSLSGMSNLLMARIIDWDALYWLGFAGFCLGNIYFVSLVVLQCIRFACTPATFRYTLSHPIECCFIPTALLAAATVIQGWFAVAQHFSTHAHLVDHGWQVLFRVWYWIYLVLSLLCSCMCYTSMFAKAEQAMHHMSPAWVLPIFPVMLCGSVANSVLDTQRGNPAVAIAVSGLTMQGVGYTVSVMMYSILLLRLMTLGFPPPRARPGLFMCVGPPSFTIISLLGTASRAKTIFHAKLGFINPNPELSYDMIYTLATLASIFLWAVSAWFFLISFSAIVYTLINDEQRKEVQFILPWWACIFPVTGFSLATKYIADALASVAVRRFAAAILVYLLIVFVMIAGAHVRAVYKGQIMGQGLDEDRIIDTMQHRYNDLENGVKQTHVGLANNVVDSQADRAGNHSMPPTYPNTPAVSVYHVDLRSSEKPAPAERRIVQQTSTQLEIDTQDVGVDVAISSANSSSSSSSSKQIGPTASRPRLMTFDSNNESNWCQDDRMRALPTTTLSI